MYNYKVMLISALMPLFNERDISMCSKISLWIRFFWVCCENNPWIDNM